MKIRINTSFNLVTKTHPFALEESRFMTDFINTVLSVRIMSLPFPDLSQMIMSSYSAAKI